MPTYAQVNVTSECGANVKTEKTKQNSELSELSKIVKRLVLN